MGLRKGNTHLGKCQVCGNQVYSVSKGKVIGHDMNCKNHGTKKLSNG